MVSKDSSPEKDRDPVRMTTRDLPMSTANLGPDCVWPGAALPTCRRGPALEDLRGRGETWPWTSAARPADVVSGVPGTRGRRGRPSAGHVFHTLPAAFQKRY